MNTTTEEKAAKRDLINKSWEYLRNNFHKFNETNKIRIALELVKKDMPTHLEGSLDVNYKEVKVVVDDNTKDNNSDIPSTQ